MIVKSIFLLLLVTLANGLQPREAKPVTPNSTTSSTTLGDLNQKKPNSRASLKEDKVLSPFKTWTEDDNSLIEVKEDEIPEGSVVYVLEEPENQTEQGETLKTANNIVFRPLFRYKVKQEAQRRNSNRVRRRYFIPKRLHREANFYPYNYNRRYY